MEVKEKLIKIKDKVKKFFSKSERFIIFGICLGLLVGIFFIHISRDKSLEYSVWISAGSKEEYKKNDYVRFKYVKPDKYISGKYLVKQVACVGGEKLELVGNKFICNNKVIAVVLDKDIKGEPLYPFKFNGVIPDGYYFLLGTHERSYDSRYFGLIYHSEIEKKLIPVRSLLVW